MNVGAFVQRNLFAFQVGNGIEGAVLGNEYRLALRGRRIVGEIDQGRTSRLRKDRRRFTCDAKVNGADVKGFEQRRPGGEFRP